MQNTGFLLPRLVLRASALLLILGSPPMRGNSGSPHEGFHLLIDPAGLSGWRGAAAYDPIQFDALPLATQSERLLAWSQTSLFRRDRASPVPARVVDGELILAVAGTCIATQQAYTDFELVGDYFLESGGEAVVHLRGSPQLTLTDESEPANRESATHPIRSAQPGAWNQIRLLLIGSRLTAWQNGRLVLDHLRLVNRESMPHSQLKAPPLAPRGPLQLEARIGVVRWRHLALRCIEPAEATTRLQETETGNLKRIFNSTSLEGWSGATSSATVKDGRLCWAENKSGVLYWNSILSNFRARLCFRLTPGANHGLAIRYSGQGNAAYDGMCELQVLDENYDRVRAVIDPRQVHGSAYGMVGALRGYQRPNGEWNFQEITVTGSLVRVELNGSVILETDLDRVNEPGSLDQKLHPGKGRRSGYFGLTGHRDYVEFNNLFIESLEP